MIEKYYTPEQLAQLDERRRAFGNDMMKQVEGEWRELFAALKTEVERGTPPEAPAVQALARQASALIQLFTGGDPGIAASLAKMYSEQPVEKIHPDFDPELFAFLQRAIASIG